MPQGNAAEGDLERLIRLFARLPGLGSRSARRAVLHLMKFRDSQLRALAQALNEVAERVKECSHCGNLDAADPCAICRDESRDETLLCVVEDVSDLWALERAGAFHGRYHVLGGTLSALEGVGPEDLRIDQLVGRVAAGGIHEVILATNLTLEGQTTAHYLADRLAASGVAMTRLARGVPVGGELDYLDDGTLVQALKARRPL